MTGHDQPAANEPENDLIDRLAKDGVYDLPAKSAATTLREGAIPDLTEIPAIGSRQRDDDERAVVARAREMVFEFDGRLREVLYELEEALRDRDAERSTRVAYVLARDYARELVGHVEQCWASAVVR